MKHNTILFIALITCIGYSPAVGQHSVAREWSEVLLEAIRGDFARPTVHARNLFHTSVGMYDAWAAYDDVASPYFLGNKIDTFECEFLGVPMPADITASREEAISFAAYRIMTHRFAESPGADETVLLMHQLMVDTLGYDTSYHSSDYTNGNPAALGNYIAERLIAFGFQDKSNEQNDYQNLYYAQVNDPIVPDLPGNPDIEYPNRWQEIALIYFVDQSGNVHTFGTPPFLSPEWGLVPPFSMTKSELTVRNRDGNDWWMYHDPGAPPYIDTNAVGGISEEYKWGFAMVSIWSAHLDPTDDVTIDISPASFGNFDIENYPSSIYDYDTYYNFLEGGDAGTGRTMNPATGQPYTPQIVKRADYARVLAEFWADGPDSETPPGHWYTILNYVNDHAMSSRKFMGLGDELDPLEWDVKAYLIMGGAMHDAAISAWGVKGYYDYLRPISAIRMMADYGQSTSDTMPNYHPAGIPLEPGYIELITDSTDVLVGDNYEHLHKIKLKAWAGPDSIGDEQTEYAGVSWIRAENWWPYQRPTFVTPPFAGYVSGHSTYSRAAAEVMTLLTGDEYFPGGKGEFIAKKDEFLVFEDGPSDDITLEWATYRDASDQTSLSRIWGGIHPPADDIPGRLMGYKIGIQAFSHAMHFFGDSVIYVDKDATGIPLGDSWERAYTNLRTALYLADMNPKIKEIRVAEGTYYASDSIRTAAFEVPSDVTILGGFTANINMPDERDPETYLTVISGEMGGAGDSDNAYHVVMIDSTVQNGLLDGLIIQDGYANGEEDMNKIGAGIYNRGKLHIRNVTIQQCVSDEDGIAVYNAGSDASLVVENCNIEN